VKIVRASSFLIDLEPEVVRTDAIQAFVKQETIFVEIGRPSSTVSSTSAGSLSFTLAGLLRTIMPR